MNEVWKDIEGFEGYAQVSNMGNIRTLDRVIQTKHYHRGRKERGRIIKLQYDKDGYVVCPLKKHGRGYLLKIHRLVAKAFVPNPSKHPCVDHIDGVRDNNVCSNLRWCTVKQNCSFDIAKKNKSESIKNSYVGNNNLRTLRAETFRKSLSKKVRVYINGHLFKEYNSQTEASKDLNISQSSISACLCGRMNGINGYTFKRVQQ